LKPLVLKGPAYRARRARIENLRLGVQLASLAVIVWIGWQFTRWVFALQAGRLEGTRPPGIEGFLPISALLTFRHWLETGEVSRVHPAGFVILGLVVATGLLLKKAFCSWLCPIGTLSESLAAIGRNLFAPLLRRMRAPRVRLPRWADLPLRSIKYLLLAFFVYAIFVKMTPRDVALFLGSPYNKVADVKMMLFFAQISTLALKTLVVLIGLSIVVPYFWCRYLCPYGALLGVTSLLSPLKITRTPKNCIDCGLCAKACPSNLAVDRATRVSSDECFGCLSCVAACPVPSALAVEAPAPWRRAVRPTVFAALVVVLFFGGINAARLAGYWRTEISEQEYLRRVQEVNAPKYSHARGSVPEYGSTSCADAHAATPARVTIDVVRSMEILLPYVISHLLRILQQELHES